MKAFVCLAISCLLIGLLYVYVRQQFAFQTSQITQLTGLIKNMAAELTPTGIEPKEEERVDEVVDDRIEVSDDSESDSDSDSSDEERVEPLRVERVEPLRVERVEPLRVEPQETRAESPRTVDVLPMELSEFVLDLPETLEEALEIDISSKKITIETNYESWSLKDLKAKISELGGPSLKTKKLMVEYLEKKV